jgi:hypothetical protein
MGAEQLNQTLFDNLTVSELIKEIHQNRKEKDTEIREIVSKLTERLDPEAVLMVGSTINSCISSLIKNDEHLVKLLSVVQKIITDNTPNTVGEGGVVNSTEISELIENAMITLNELNKESSTIDADILKIKSEVAEFDVFPTTDDDVKY